MSINIFAYNPGSASAKVLADSMNIKIIKHNGSRYKPGPHKSIINWGCSTIPPKYFDSRIINAPSAVAIASNKLETYKILDGLVPPWSTSLAWAQKQVVQGRTVVARTLLRANSGRGIVLMEPNDPETFETVAPVYSLYIKKQDEYRIHVAFGEVIAVQRKALSAEFQGNPDVNWKIRNLANGFIFAREGVKVPDHAMKDAIEAVQLLRLNFGAVDMIYNKKNDMWTVLEVNTAPGLAGSTVDDYTTAFRNYFGA